MKVLVTGGAGFIGSNLVGGACSSAATTSACSTTSPRAAARNLEGLDVEVVEGELRSYERVHAAVRGVEVVYHLGALGSVPRSVQDPLTSSAVNVEGTLNVLLAARDEGVRRVVFSSSTSVYGSSRELPTRESTAARPDLAVRRREARRRAVLHQLQPRLRHLRDGRAALLQRLRPAAEPALAVRRRRAAVHRRDRPRASRSPIYGDGEQSRDFTYVANVVDATIRAAEAPGASGRVFNVAAGAPASVNHVADTIGVILGKPVEKRFEPPRPGDIRDSWADITAAREMLGYEPHVDLEAGLELTAEAIACPSLSRVRVLRVIARLNMGGPALHVAYLTAGLARARLRDDARRRDARARRGLDGVRRRRARRRRRPHRRSSAARSRRSATSSRRCGSRG